MSTIVFKDSLVLKVLAVNNRLTASLAPDTPPGQGGKMANICDIMASGFVYTSSTTEIDMTGPVKNIHDQLKRFVPFSAIGSGYNSSGSIHFQIIADGNVAAEVNESIGSWSSKQWMYEIDPQ